MHLFHASYWYLNYVVDLIILFGGVFGGIRGYIAYQKRRLAKRDKEEQATIEAAVKTAVEISVAKILTTVDDKVHRSVTDQLQEVKDQIALVGSRVKEVHDETHNNGGSSMKDSVDRMEANVTKLLTGQDVQRAILKNQDEKIEDISEIQVKNGEAITEVKIAVAAHIGAHTGLPPQVLHKESA